MCCCWLPRELVGRKRYSVYMCVEEEGVVVESNHCDVLSKEVIVVVLTFL